VLGNQRKGCNKKPSREGPDKSTRVVNQEEEIQKCLEDLEQTNEISFTVAPNLGLNRKITKQE